MNIRRLEKRINELDKKVTEVELLEKARAKITEDLVSATKEATGDAKGMICDRCFHANVCGEEGAFEPALTYCADYIGWSPISEGLPENDTEVIVSCTDDSGDSEFSYTTTGWHFQGLWVVGNDRNYFVRAWMPLPKKPYEPQEQEVEK